jgi:hypothetical protein
MKPINAPHGTNAMLIIVKVGGNIVTTELERVKKTSTFKTKVKVSVVCVLNRLHL